MSVSFYQLSVPSYLQGLGGVQTYLAKGLGHCADKGIDPATFVSSTLFEDMWSFDKQVQSACHHSLGAVKGLKAGVFNPPVFSPDIDYEGLVRLVDSTIAELEAQSESEIDAMYGNDMRFEAGERKMAFTAQDFVSSFSFPNFFFHCTTGFDILRHNGVPVGKRHYIGKMRIKG